MFGETPTGIILLDAILLLVGAVLTPILFGIFKRVGEVSLRMTSCVNSLAQANTTIGEVVKELNDARVRDTALEGRSKGINEKLDRHIAEDRKAVASGQ